MPARVARRPEQLTQVSLPYPRPGWAPAKAPELAEPGCVIGVHEQIMTGGADMGEIDVSERSAGPSR